jgi:hypothetical protein
MPRKKKSGASAWRDTDDAPELTDLFFDRADIRKGGKLIRRGRLMDKGGNYYSALQAADKNNLSELKIIIAEVVDAQATNEKS